MNTFDFHGKLVFKLSKWHEAFSLFVYGLISSVQLLVWKISTAGRCYFYGLTKFSRAPGSEIIIGKGCRFRSVFWSNAAGINRRCMVSTIKPGAKVEIGNYCGFSGTVIASAINIKIGNAVLFGANVTVTDTDFHGVRPLERNGSGVAKPVVIKNNVWLGLNVIVLKGVTIGENSVIAAGSIVVSDIPDNVVAAGQPARVVRQFS